MHDAKTIDEDVVLKTIGKHAVPPRAVSKSDKIVDLDIDSLSVVEIVIELEDELDIEIPFNAHNHELGEDSTVADLIDHITKMAASPKPVPGDTEDPASPDGDGAGGADTSE